MLTRYHPSEQYVFCSSTNAHPRYDDRARHAIAAFGLGRLVALATPAPYGSRRVDTGVRLGGPLVASVWLIISSQGKPGALCCLRPIADHERGVIVTWLAFEARRLRRRWQGAALMAAAGRELVWLNEAGALDWAI